MHHKSEAKGRDAGRDRSQSRATITLPGSAAALGAVVTDRFGSYVHRWSQTSLGYSLVPSRGRLATRTVAFAATATLAIALAVAIGTSTHISFTHAVIVAFGAALQPPSPLRLSRAFVKIRKCLMLKSKPLSCAFRQRFPHSERYGIEQPDINPPVKLVDTHGDPSNSDISRRMAMAETTSSDFFLSQLVNRPRLTVILGESGAGKTSLLLRLTYRMLLDRQKDNRSFIPLSSSVETGQMITPRFING